MHLALVKKQKKATNLYLAPSEHRFASFRMEKKR
jgi:hypothetical protein